MAKKKRKPRKATKGVDILKPIDINKFGTKDDPCFGKEYDLSTDECSRCGDSELCAAVFGQTTLKKTRDKVESKNRFKDKELFEDDKNPALTKWVRDKKEEGLKRSEIIKKAKATFGSTREEIKKIYKNL
ncbi:MAG: hypothetical protein CL596_04935 [Alteromonas sp.]|nr:hypothetical protein [Alteromonas sp.]|tara:strand:- start:14949 stop:15338 length:390 start_codon:yes stop_codon:yes gene_type:complete